MGWINNMLRWRVSSTPASVPALPLGRQQPVATGPVRVGYDDGEKYPGGFGSTNILVADYWTLRARSSELFSLNLYARGLIRRLVTNEINTGLHLEATPEESLLGFDEDGLADWSERVENLFRLWSTRADLCHHTGQHAFGRLQAIARQEALVAGDVLIVLHQDPGTKLPRVNLISGSAVQTPLQAPKLPKGSRIEHGVELDGDGRHVAYWIQRLASRRVVSERLSARGAKSGRRQAWLMYGTDRRLGDVRGRPLLSLVLQSLKEIDRYRDAVQRKAALNAVLAMFIKKTADKPGTMPMSGGGAVRKSVESVTDSAGVTRTFNAVEMLPGLVLDELQVGEEPVGFQPHGTDEKFGDFEEAVIQAVAWANEVPPEIMRLSFSSNYSASQAANNEFQMYLDRVRDETGEALCQPIYEEWLVSQVLSQRVEAPGFLEATRDRSAYEVLGAWNAADWTGHIKPAVDLVKRTRGYNAMIEMGAITRDRAARELTGTKYSKNIQKLRRENEQLAHANEPLLAAEEAEPEPPTATTSAVLESDGFEEAVLQVVGDAS